MLRHFDSINRIKTCIRILLKDHPLTSRSTQQRNLPAYFTHVLYCLLPPGISSLLTPGALLILSRVKNRTYIRHFFINYLRNSRITD